jgi:multiple sugar transport system permease protein
MDVQVKSAKHVLSKIAQYIVLCLGTLVAVGPLITVVFASFKGDKEYYNTSVLQPPENWLNWSNYIHSFVKANMPLAFRNTAVILLFTLIGSVLCGTMIAYVLSRFDFKGKKLLRNLFLLANLIPGVTMQVSCYKIMTNLHLVNSLPGIILLYMSTDIISIYIFLQFFDSLPRSLDEAGLLDGANYFTIFFRILFPLLKPAITTVCILKGVATYKEFYLANLYLQTRSRLVTVSTCLYTFSDEYGNQYNYICAGIMITIVPILILFLCSQKYIYNGIAQGAIKE